MGGLCLGHIEGASSVLFLDLDVITKMLALE